MTTADDEKQSINQYTTFRVCGCVLYNFERVTHEAKACYFIDMCLCCERNPTGITCTHRERGQLQSPMVRLTCYALCYICVEQERLHVVSAAVLSLGSLRHPSSSSASSSSHVVLVDSASVCQCSRSTLRLPVFVPKPCTQYTQRNTFARRMVCTFPPTFFICNPTRERGAS